MNKMCLNMEDAWTTTLFSTIMEVENGILKSKYYWK